MIGRQAGFLDCSALCGMHGVKCVEGACQTLLPARARNDLGMASVGAMFGRSVCTWACRWDFKFCAFQMC
jgi:hypothetical protein